MNVFSDYMADVYLDQEWPPIAGGQEEPIALEGDAAYWRQRAERAERQLAEAREEGAAAVADLTLELTTAREQIDKLMSMAGAANAEVMVLQRQLAEASRVCDQPGCTAAVVRRDDGARVCAAGHRSRWVEVTDLYQVQAQLAEALSALRAISAVGIHGAFPATSGEGHAECRAIAEAALARLEETGDALR